MGWARAPWSLTIQSGLGRCYEVSYVPVCRGAGRTRLAATGATAT